MDHERWYLGEQLEARIERYQVRDAHRALDVQLDAIFQEGLRQEVRRYRCVVPMSRCVNGAVRAGVERGLAMETYGQRLEQLSRLKTWPELQRHLHHFADEMLELVKPERRTNIERLVAHIRQNLRQRLGAPATLQEYAEAAGVSRSHLSRCFTRIAGRSFRDELCDVRIKAACKLLRDTLLKVGAIAHQVGLRDTSQFIADFRRQTGMTPAVYRRRHHEAGD